MTYTGYFRRLFARPLLTVLCFVALSSVLQAQKTDAKTWKMGKSIGMSTFSEADFVNLKNKGFDCVEVTIKAETPENERIQWCKDIKAKADKAGIEIWSLHLPFSRKLDLSVVDPKGRQEMIDLCASMIRLTPLLGVRKFVIHPSSEPITDEQRAERLANSQASLTILNKVAKEQNVQLVVECLPRTCLGNTSDEMLKLLKGLDDSFGVCFDTNHLLKEKPEEFAVKVGSRIKSLHVSDYDGVDERHWTPGKGIIDWKKVVIALEEAGYEGPFMFEAAGKPEELMDFWNKTKAAL